jgi:ATP-binding cassette subfamily B protein
MRHTIKKSLQQALRIDRAVRMVWKSAPGWTLVNTILVVVQGLLPLAALYLIKLIVDAVAAGIAHPGESSLFSQVLPLILLAGGIALIGAICRSLSELTAEAQAMVVTDDVSDILHEKSIAVDLSYYEDPQYYDSLHRAQREAPYRPMHIVNGLVQIGQNGLALIGIVGLLFAFNWVIGLILFAVALPGALARFIYSRKLYGFEQNQTETERQAAYYHLMLTDSDHAKEVRLFNTGPVFWQRFRDLRQQLRAGRLSISRRRSLSDLMAQALATIAIFSTFAFIVSQAITAKITLGALVMYYQGFQSGLGFLQSILRNLAGLYEDNLFLTNFYQFLELSPKIQSPSHPLPLPAKAEHGICFEGVSFSYPSSGANVLSEIDLELKPDQVIALVGENGAGKTTLIKLLCRLYDPTEGKITIEGIDLRQLNPERLRQEISVLFQDYVHYYLSAKENIWLGNVEKNPDEDQIINAAVKSGADPIIRGLPNGYDTMLGYQFQSGQELSIGEWQKVALARTFLRDSRIIVLDEPTSSIDPLAEAELFRQFRSLIKGRSAILISHRFSTVQMADYIYVLDKGKIIERGTHQTLLDLNGRYALLYKSQANYYQ